MVSREDLTASGWILPDSYENIGFQKCSAISLETSGT
jgi:hypothetical protein